MAAKRQIQGNEPWLDPPRPCCHCPIRRRIGGKVRGVREIFSGKRFRGEMEGFVKKGTKWGRVGGGEHWVMRELLLAMSAEYKNDVQAFNGYIQFDVSSR